MNYKKLSLALIKLSLFLSLIGAIYNLLFVYDYITAILFLSLAFAMVLIIRYCYE